VLTTIFQGIRIYDGTGSAPFVTDVALAGDRIALIGELGEREALERIPCAGLSLAPGFIDVHSHSDELWLADGRALSKIHQGVTTEIGGNCGTSAAPLHGYALERKKRSAAAYGVGVEWTSLDEFFTLVEREGVALNVASLVGLGTTRQCVSGASERRLDDAELEREARLVREAVEQGALGVSSGLIYEPSRYADLRELSALAIAARAAGAPRYVSHLRDEGDRLLDAVTEALEVGARAEVAVQCSHHKAAWKRNWGKVHGSLELLDRARARGQSVCADAYPYVAMWTELATVLPEQARRGGPAATLERLRDPEAALAIALALNLHHGDAWSDILITDVRSERNAELAGLRIDELSRRWRLSPARTVIRLLDEEELEVDCAFFAMSEDDVATVLSADFVCVGSDASARAPSGVTARGVPHPRTFGCFPRVFGRFVRQRGTFETAEAIRRMTSLPAAIFGIAERGIVAPGYFADLVVFDEKTIVDRATYEHPYAYPEGVVHVYVNGRAAVVSGEATRERAGRVLRGGRA
jgi:N-acyl-D-amino-acid deacylase